MINQLEQYKKNNPDLKIRKINNINIIFLKLYVIQTILMILF